MDIPAQRLANQRLTSPRPQTVAQLVQHLGAVQAQEYPFAKWGLALRLPGRMSDEDVERAHTDGEILRTHVMRPTWHFVAAADIVWMLELTAPRVQLALRSYLQHQGLDGKLMTRSVAVFERALAGGHPLTRADLRGNLARAGIKPNSLQLGMITMYAELERVICSGPRRGRDATYALLSERAPSARRLSADDALGTLARRFFASHAPATLRDFVWWSGLRTVEARRGIEIARLDSAEHDGLSYYGHAAARARARTPIGPSVHLLPIYDEYTVAYRDRRAVPHGPARVKTASGTIAFRHALVIDGLVAGTWTTTKDRSGQYLRVTPLRRLTARERAAIRTAADHYGTYLGAQLQLEIR